MNSLLPIPGPKSSEPLQLCCSDTVIKVCPFVIHSYVGACKTTTGRVKGRVKAENSLDTLKHTWVSQPKI